MKFHAYHGVYEEEKLNGNDFLLDLSFETDLHAAGQSDQLADTIDYTSVYQVVAGEMTLPSSLLEHLAARIIQAVRDRFPGIGAVELVIRKINPPMGGQVQAVVLTLRDES